MIIFEELTPLAFTYPKIGHNGVREREHLIVARIVVWWEMMTFYL